MQPNLEVDNQSYEKGLSPQQKDLNAIAVFLSNRELILIELKRLDAILTEIAKKRDCYDEDTKGLKGYREGYPYKENKLTSAYLYQWARENGFNESVTLNEGLDEQRFSEVLRQGSLFKDKAFRGEFHGEWVHFIQWWCIVEYNKGSHFLATLPAQLYRWIGQQRNSPWFMTFEVYGSGQENNNAFRSFQDLNGYLLSLEAAQDLPILHQVIKGRAKKEDANRKTTVAAYLAHANKGLLNEKPILEKFVISNNHIKPSYFKFFKPDEDFIKKQLDYKFCFNKMNVPEINVSQEQFNMIIQDFFDESAILSKPFTEERKTARSGVP